MQKTRVLVADDSKFMKAAYKKILHSQKHLKVVATASDGTEAVAQAEATKPDVAILDIRMPNMGGIEAVGRILDSRPGTGIVIVFPYHDAQYFVELLKFGAGGKAYILNTSIDDIDSLISAVEGVGQGETILDPYFQGASPEAALKYLETP